MKNYISINQGNFVKIAELKNIKVDANDGILFDWIQNFTKSNKALKKLIDNKLYIWVSYTAIREDNPLCNINTNDVIGRRLNKLVELGLLEKFLSKEDGNKTFFHVTQYAFDYLLESRELPTQKSEPLPTFKSDNSKLDNSKLDSKKINTKNDLKPIDLISYYKENISSKNEKIKETKAINAIFMKKDQLQEILIGLKNYKLLIDFEETKENFKKNLFAFVDEKIYLDYQEKPNLKAEPNNFNNQPSNDINNIIDEMYPDEKETILDVEVTE